MFPFADANKAEEIIFEYRRDGKDSGFLRCKDEEYVFKPDRLSAATIPLEKLKNNLRVMVKTKQARLIKAGSVEAVAVPKHKFIELYR